MRRWLFLPTDDRPITCRFPVQLAPLGGVELVAPPRSMLGRFLTPGDCAGLAGWLRQEAPGCEGAILSLEMLAYGGLVASRGPAVELEEALRRLALLRELKGLGLTLYASSVVMRLGITGSSPEAVRLHQLLHRWSQVVVDPGREGERRQLERQIPPAVLSGYRLTRKRNHQVNRAAVELVAEGALDRLLLLQEDATPTGIHREEQANLQSLITPAGLGGRVQLQPGADEGALLLLARAALSGREGPVITPVYARPATAERIAPYEDRPLWQTLALQVEAAGGQVGSGGVQLFVNTPVSRYGDAGHFAPGADRRAISDGSPALVSAIGAALLAGRPAAVADVAFANGADPLFTPILLRQTGWVELHGYAAWNTAGNSLGCAIAMAVLAHVDGGRQPHLRRRAILTRMLDDFAYQTRVRTGLNGRLEARGLSPYNLGAQAPSISLEVGALLQTEAAPIIRQSGLKIGRVLARLPWPRTFEVEIDLVEA